jgi:putative tryptophan/tyrosine transport system substrate-binding protein
VRLPVAIIIALGPQAIQAAVGATKTIPIVMGRMDDADAHGFVTNYARPEGNVTGMSLPSGELVTKWLQMLKEILPQGARIAALWDTGGTSNQVRTVQQAARVMAIDLDILRVRGPEDFPEAFSAARKSGIKGLLILGSPVMTSQLLPLAALTATHQLAAIYTYRDFAVAGGLLSYGPTDTDPNFAYRRTAYFIDRLLRGAKPGDLPVEQPSRYHLTINRKTADALGLTIPPHLYIFADEVIE